MNTELPLAQGLSTSTGQSPDKQREELAVLEGHDADILPTRQEPGGEDSPLTQEAGRVHASAPQAQTTTDPSDQSFALPSYIAGSSIEGQTSQSGLAPSTISQWLPGGASNPSQSAVSEATSLTSYETAQSTATETAPPPDSDQPDLTPTASAAVLPSTFEPASLRYPEKVPPTEYNGTTSSPARTSPSTSREHNEKISTTDSTIDKEIDLEAGPRISPLTQKEPETLAAEADPNIVDWDGPDDPANPLNWSEAVKWGNVAVIASITFLTQVINPLASSMFAPGVPSVMKDFHSDNQQLASFVVSIYILGYAFGPMFLAPLSELYGRLPMYHMCNTLFVIFTIACAVANNLSALIVFRFFEGVFGSCPLTIGGGTIADMIVQQKRGGVMAIWALGPLMGPVIGPVAGGYLAQAKGWRWVFWVIAMAAGAIALCAVPFLRETYAPVLLERKAARLRKETGNENLKSRLQSKLTPAELFKLSIVRPMKLLVFSPIVLALSVYMAVVYGYLYLLFTTITEVYEAQYHFSSGSVGLTYLGIGVGSLFGVITFGIASDKIVKYLSKQGEMKAEYRLPPMIPGSFFIPVGLFLYGWTADKHVFYIAPIIGTGLVGVGLLATFMPIQTYLVDAYTIYAASALAANTILRSLVGALLPLAGQKMYATLGLGWGNSLLAFIATALCPIPILFYKYGERIRKNPRFQVKL